MESRLEARGLSAGATGLVRIWSAATQFPEGFDLLTSASEGESPMLQFTLGREHFPHPLRAGAQQRVRRTRVMVAGTGFASDLEVSISRPEVANEVFSLGSPPAGLEGLSIGAGEPVPDDDLDGAPLAQGAWTVLLPVDSLQGAAIEDVFIVVEYVLG